MIQKVIINPIAFEKLLVHILQFGNKSIPKSEEVLGICYGNEVKEIVEIQDIIPFKHGESCKSVFTDGEKDIFKKIDKKYSRKNLFPFGYYCSHPNNGFYLSQVELKNLTYFLKDANNPKAIVIIADHAKMDEENFGIMIYSIKHDKSNTTLDYQPISMEIAKPDGIRLFKTTKYLIEQGQRNKIYIEEQGMSADVSDSWQDSVKNAKILENKITKKVAPTLELLKVEFKENELDFFRNGLESYEKILDEMEQILSKILNDPSGNVISMQKAIDLGFNKIIEWFKENFIAQSNRSIEEFRQRTTSLDDSVNNINDAFKRLLVNRIQEYERLLEYL